MNNIVFLTSRMDFYDKDENDNRIPKNFGNENNILDNLKKYIKKYDNLLYIASNETSIELTDEYAGKTFISFDKTLPFKNYEILDIRTENNLDNLIKNADLIILGGGHVPTENKFFEKINLKEKIKTTDAVIIGISAGTMNSAENVYSAPELEGESIDKEFNKNLSGLGLTNINVLPHYNDCHELFLDNKKYIEDIIIPDSYGRKIYAINDGSYFLVENGNTYLFGDAYIIENGKITRIEHME